MSAVAAWFGPRFAVSSEGAFDRLLADGDVLDAGSIRVQAIATPGHTPACTTFLIDGRLFTGDALFLPDFGTGRCDFPGGSARQLWASIQKLYERFSDDTPYFTGHDYQPGGRELRWTAELGESKAHNQHCRQDTPEAEFVAWREARDRTLKLPALLFPAIQVNIAGGRLPAADAEGRVLLRLPIGLF
jgi:glyoxylase-like metal-dependent hydrolase (beta-lactamase superfamily II)